MGINVANEPDPRALGAYSFEAGAAPARRENVITSMKMAQDQNQFQQNLAANVAQSQNRMMADAAQQQAAREDGLRKEAMQQEGYRQLNENKAAESEADRQQDWQNAEANRRLTREKEFNDSVATGLKDGSLYYSPQQKQQLATIDHGIAQIYSDLSVAKDHQDEMAERLRRQRRSIIPMVRPENERPVPIEQRAGQSIVVHTKDGKVIPLSELGRAPEEGEATITVTTRNGAEKWDYKPVKPQKVEAVPDPHKEAWSKPEKAAPIKAQIRARLQHELDVKYDNEVAAWKQQEKAHIAKEARAKNASEDPSKYVEKDFEPPYPTKQTPTQEKFDHEVWRESQGLQGVKPPDPNAPLVPGALLGGAGSAFSGWAAAVAGAMNPVAPPAPGAPPAAQLPPPPQAAPAPPPVDSPFDTKQSRQDGVGVMKWLDEQGLTPYAYGATPRDLAVMPTDAYKQFLNGARARKAAHEASLASDGTILPPRQREAAWAKQQQDIAAARAAERPVEPGTDKMPGVAQPAVKPPAPVKVGQRVYDSVGSIVTNDGKQFPIIEINDPATNKPVKVVVQDGKYIGFTADADGKITETGEYFLPTYDEHRRPKDAPKDAIFVDTNDEAAARKAVKEGKTFWDKDGVIYRTKQ